MNAVSIDSLLKFKCPNTALACVTAHVEAYDSPAALREEMSRCEADIAGLSRAALDTPQIAATRSAYKALGKDPARYRGSAEALVRRILAGKGLPHINAVVDIINLVSAESRLPIGLYDLGRVSGDVVFRAGRAGETYKGIGKYDLNLEGLPVFCDTLGPHGSPTSDSERTMVTKQTTRVLAIVVSFAGPQGLEDCAQHTIDLLQRHALGRNCELTVVF